MPSKIYEIDLDIKDSSYKLVPFIEVVSGDTDANIFNIQLLENFQPVNTSGNTVVIIFGKPDRTTVFQNLIVVDATTGKFTCTLSSQTIAVPGRIKAEVVLYEGTKKLTSVTFEFVIRKPILDENTVESSNEFTALTEALQTVNQYDSRISTVEQDQAAHKAESANKAHGGFKGVMVRLTSNQSIPNNTTTEVSWGSEEYDTDNFWDIGIPSRLIVPEGVTKVRLSVNLRFANSSDQNFRRCDIRKNGVFAGAYGLGYALVKNGGASPYGEGSLNVTSAIMSVNSGDYFTLYINQNSGSSLDLQSSQLTWFMLEVVE